MTIRSMTAFARTENEDFVWEVRSVNHRYLDISFRVPENFRHLEAALRTLCRGKAHRGKLDCTLKITGAASAGLIEINENLVLSLKEALGKVSALSGLAPSMSAFQLMKWPGVILTEGGEDELRQSILAGFSESLDALVEMREREGAELAAAISTKMDEAEKLVAEARKEAPRIEASHADKLRQRIESLDVETDPGRLETELVIMAQKLDVMEELDRLDAHIAEVRRNLNQPEPVGRRLDFLMQELNREANTLSSKAAAASATHHAVELKVIIEQMREQVQNIE